MEKINYCIFNVFSFSAGDNVKTSDLELHSVESFAISVSVKNSSLHTAIYLLEKFYYKEIY